MERRLPAGGQSGGGRQKRQEVAVTTEKIEGKGALERGFASGGKGPKYSLS